MFCDRVETLPAEHIYDSCKKNINRWPLRETKTLQFGARHDYTDVFVLPIKATETMMSETMMSEAISPDCHLVGLKFVIYTWSRPIVLGDIGRLMFGVPWDFFCLSLRNTAADWDFLCRKIDIMSRFSKWHPHTFTVKWQNPLLAVAVMIGAKEEEGWRCWATKLRWIGGSTQHPRQLFASHFQWQSMLFWLFF